MSVVVSRGNTVVATVAGTGTWTTTANVIDGNPGGPLLNTYALWTSSGASDVGSITIGGYTFGLSGYETITAVTVSVASLVTATLHITSITCQLQDSTGANIGAAQSVTLNTVDTAVVVTPNVLPTTAQAVAGLRVLLTCTNSTGVTSRGFSFDDADVTLTYSVLGHPTSVFFDAGGPGNFGKSAAGTYSWTHTATAGADVFVPITVITSSGTPVCSGITYGGNAMTLMGNIFVDSSTIGNLYLFHAVNVAGGAQTVSQTLTATTTYWSANSFSYLNVGAVGAAATVGTNVGTQAVTNVGGGMMFSAFGAFEQIATAGAHPIYSGSAGGTFRYTGEGFDGTSFYAAGTIVQDSNAASTTFTETGGSFPSGIAVVMRPRPVQLANIGVSMRNSSVR